MMIAAGGGKGKGEAAQGPAAPIYRDPVYLLIVSLPEQEEKKKRDFFFFFDASPSMLLQLWMNEPEEKGKSQSSNSPLSLLINCL